jgi:carbamoyl-phosphate synthase large subunit
VRRSTEAIAAGVGVRGLLNVQFALAADVLYVLEANPRASRTVPFVSKATAVPLAKAAARIMLGDSIADLRAEGLLPASGDGTHLPAESPVSVKEAVLPFKRFVTSEGLVVDSVLGPEMRSTGEVMGLDEDFGTAFAKSQSAAYGSGLPDGGTVFVSVANRDKRAMIFPVKRLVDLGFTVLATEGTAEVLRRNGVSSTVVRKHSDRPSEDGEPTIVQRILAGEVDMVVNTPSGRSARADGYEIRAATTSMDRPIITTVQQLAAAVQGIEAARTRQVTVRSLQEHARQLADLAAAPGGWAAGTAPTTTGAQAGTSASAGAGAGPGRGVPAGAGSGAGSARSAAASADAPVAASGPGAAGAARVTGPA